METGRRRGFGNGTALRVDGSEPGAERCGRFPM
jgi:hypothetical protein